MDPDCPTLEVTVANLRNAFVAKETTTADIVAWNRSFLARVPTADINMLSNDDIERRLEVAGKIQELRIRRSDPTQTRPGFLNKFEIAVILFSPQELVDSWVRDDFLFSATMTQTKQLVQLFLQRPEMSKKRNNADSRHKVVPRRQNEVEKCRTRDENVCLLTRVPQAEACHIFPYAANSVSKKFYTLCDFRILIGKWSNQATVLTQNLGSSDYAWNMLCLCPNMHLWWSRALWAFKCLEVRADGPDANGNDQAVVVLQFHWMPKAMQAATREDGSVPWEPVDLGAGDAKTLVGDWFREKRDLDGAGGVDNRYIAHNVVTHRDVRSGQTIEIRLAASDAPKMKAMIDIQWACIQLATMSGAAGLYEFLFDSDDSDDSDEGDEVYFMGRV